MIAAILSTLIALGAGAAVCTALPSRDRRFDGLFLAESYLLGIGVQAAVLFVVPWSLAMIVEATAVVVAALWWRGKRWSFERSEITPWNLIDLVTLVLIAGYVRFATIGPSIENDFVSIWGVKARTFFVARGIDWTFLQQPYNAWAHLDYPLLVPLAYDFQSIVGGAWVDRWAGVLTACFGAATLLILRSFLRDEVSRPVRAAATLILMPCAFSPFIGLAEGPMIAYGTAALLYARRGVRDGDRADLLRAGIHLGLAASCKNEGLSLIAAVALAMIFAGAWRRIVWLWPSVAIAAPWLIMRRVQGLRADLTQGGIFARAVEHLRDPLPILRALAEHPPGRPLFWAGILLALLVGVRRLPRERFLALALVLQLLAFVAAYVVTPHDVSWHIRWSWERIVMQLAPALVFLAVVAMAGPLTRKAAFGGPVG